MITTTIDRSSLIMYPGYVPMDHVYIIIAHGPESMITCPRPCTMYLRKHIYIYIYPIREWLRSSEEEQYATNPLKFLITLHI
jgi:hypothetical protein